MKGAGQAKDGQASGRAPRLPSAPLLTGAVLAQKLWGALPHLPLHQRVHFRRSPKPEKYELH